MTQALTVVIEDGCIACGVCRTHCPEIFAAHPIGAVAGAARSDGVTDDNQSRRSPLRTDLPLSAIARLRDARAGCPVECLHVV
jgi:ferredoxin